MGERARIRFNPSTGEIEVEGSETFVKTYFQKLQEQFSHTDQERDAAQVRKKAQPAGKTIKAGRQAGEKKVRRGTQTGAVIALVREHTEGTTTSELKDKTGLTERQIWGIVYRAEKQGKIKKTKRGLYVAA
jgi:hypothetical protein